MVYDWKIGIKKLAKSAAIVVLTGLLVVWQDDARYLAIIPALEYGLNWLKHK